LRVCFIARRIVGKFICGTAKVGVTIGLETRVVRPAFGWSAGLAPPGIAAIVDGASIPIIARLRVRCEMATALGVAAIIGAGIAIVANKRGVGDTLAQMAMVTQAAYIRVIAGRVVKRMKTTDFRVARVGCTNLSIITIDQFSPVARTTCTSLS